MHIFSKLVAPENIRIVVFGFWDQTWMDALGPQSEIWLHLPMVSEVIVVPDANAINIPTSKNPIRKTVLLPLMEEHIIRCPSNYLALASGENIIKTLSQKHIFDNYLKTISQSHLAPKLYENANKASYPFILKRVDLNAGNGIFLVESFMQLCNLDDDFLVNKPVIYQEYIKTTKEYVTHLVCRDGDILWASTFEYSLKNQEVIRTPNNIQSSKRVLIGEDILEKFMHCLKPLKFSGPCNIDYKVTEDGNLKILEINPRFGGSLMLKHNSDLLQQAIRAILFALSGDLK